MWQCPICQSALSGNEQWRCTNHHHFDKSRFGYVNLLPVQKKKSLQPGDNKEMLSARRTFHNALAYKPLMSAMATLLVQHLSGIQDDVVLYDAGCGEGTYLNFCKNYLAEHGIVTKATGSDISRQAVEFAARRYPDASFVVASSFDLPVCSEQCDAILQVFAPGADGEFARILKPKGYLLHAAPGPKHLASLKSAVYNEVREHVIPDDNKPGFDLLQREHLNFDVDLSDNSTKQALLTMTPFTWRLSQSVRDRLMTEMQAIEADFVISLWQKAE